MGKGKGMKSPRQIFLLSPASTSGRRAAMLFNERAAFPLAVALRRARGPQLGDVFSFVSGLYFRGKLAYARAFARGPRGVPGVQVITSNRGLLKPDVRISIADLQDFARTPIDAGNTEYREPLMRDALKIAAQAGADTRIVLLGSIASGKYVDVLLDVFGDRLVFPEEFVGRGDMSRGGLVLRCVDEQRELTYVPVAGALRHGKRPPKLKPR
ncbi:MAG TPA: hypothetical protein VM100_10515 [Longimicrobiales bacterium]|nr:hypothetical protein [Longimicrobiales bacterium]